MDIIPHPAALKKRERELIDAESELSLRACKIYSMELELEKLLVENYRKEKRLKTALLVFFSFGEVLGYTVFSLMA